MLRRERERERRESSVFIYRNKQTSAKTRWVSYIVVHYWLHPSYRGELLGSFRIRCGWWRWSSWVRAQETIFFPLPRGFTPWGCILRPALYHSIPLLLFVPGGAIVLNTICEGELCHLIPAVYEAQQHPPYPIPYPIPYVHDSSTGTSWARPTYRVT